MKQLNLIQQLNVLLYSNKIVRTCRVENNQMALEDIDVSEVLYELLSLIETLSKMVKKSTVSEMSVEDWQTLKYVNKALGL